MPIPKFLWEDNRLQFARFIAEAEAAGAFTPDVLERMSEDMDLSIPDVCEIIEDAQKEFDEIKSML